MKFKLLVLNLFLFTAIACGQNGNKIQTNMPEKNLKENAEIKKTSESSYQMKKIFILFFIITSCNQKYKLAYEDYNDEDFLPVQGIITKVYKKGAINNFIKKDIHFIYNLGKEKPSKGYEVYSPYILNEGEPAIILVHKDNDSISFFGSRGIIQKKLLLDYLKKCDLDNGIYYGVDN